MHGTAANPAEIMLAYTRMLVSVAIIELLAFAR